MLALCFNRLPASFREHALGTGLGAGIGGAALFALGLWLAVLARMSLGENWGMPMTEKERPELVTTGIYGYVRHPIYIGMLLMMLGSAWVVNAYWLLVFVVAAGYFVVSAVVEEHNLERQFGKPYERYRRKTKMFVPFVA